MLKDYIEPLSVLVCLALGLVAFLAMLNSCNSCHKLDEMTEIENRKKYLEFMTECVKTRAPLECKEAAKQF